jgi:hypothetical protein
MSATKAPYGKVEFEADLNALGPIPRGPYTDLHELMGPNDESSWAVVTGAIGGVSLLGVLPNSELPYNVREKLEKMPAAYAKDRDGLHVTVGGTLTSYNPYALTTYFPEGNDGQGEAAYYWLREPFAHEAPAQTRIITDYEATQRLVRDAYIVDAGRGILVPRVEVERAYSLMFSKGHANLMRRDDRNYDNFVKQVTPRVTVSINPYDMDGELRLEEPISHGGAIINRLSFVGSTSVEMSSVAYRYSDEEGIDRVAPSLGAKATFTQDNPLYLATSGWASRKAWNVADYLSIMPRARGKNGEILPPTLRGSMDVTEAIRHGVNISYDRYVSASAMLYDAVTTDRDTKYLNDLRDELRPEVGTAEVLADVRRMAKDQWLEVFRGERCVEPQAIGLREVALWAHIYRRR